MPDASIKLIMPSIHSRLFPGALSDAMLDRREILSSCELFKLVSISVGYELQILMLSLRPYFGRQVTVRKALKSKVQSEVSSGVNQSWPSTQYVFLMIDEKAENGSRGLHYKHSVCFCFPNERIAPRTAAVIFEDQYLFDGERGVQCDAIGWRIERYATV